MVQAFSNKKYWELREDVKPYFDLLKNCGLYHTSAQSLCNHINKVYDDVDT